MLQDEAVPGSLLFSKAIQDSLDGGRALGAAIDSALEHWLNQRALIKSTCQFSQRILAIINIEGHELQLHDNIHRTYCVNLRLQVTQVLQEYLVHLAALDGVDAPCIF